jgi:hypothetical protein
MTVPTTSLLTVRPLRPLLVLAVVFVFLCPARAQQLTGNAFRSTSIVKKTPSGHRQLLVADIVAADSVNDVDAEILLPGQPRPITISLGNVSRGTSRHFFEVPVIGQADSAVLHLLVQGKRVFSTKGAVIPPRIRKVYDVQVSHHDLGYADYYPFMRRDVREMGIEMALDYCRRTDSLPPPDRFHWTVETSEPMTKFISSQPPDVIRDLTQRIKEGRIALGGLHNSVYTEMMGYESMARLFYTPNRHIRDLLGIPPSRTALIDDVVGFVRTLPTYLKEADIPYFYHGYNETVNGMYPASDQPVFYWEGRDGDSKQMPLFRSFPYYSPDRLTKYSVQEIAGLLERYEQGRQWPYDCLIAEDSYDFSLPQFENVEGIRQWNDDFANPVLISGTFDMFFDDVVQQADRTKIKVYDQDAPDAWADQDASDGKLMGDARLLNFELPTVEKLATLAFASGGKGYPWKDIWQAYHTLISYHEHTDGAFSEEDVAPIPFQKTRKAANANYYECEQVMHKGLVGEAEICTRSARTQAIDQLKQLITAHDDSTLVVFNPLSFSRSGLAMLPLARGDHWRIIDNTSGKEVVSQEMPGGDVLFLAEGVPSFGYRTYHITRGRHSIFPERTRPAKTESLENDYYRIRIDDSTGALSSIVDKKRNLELVDQTSEFKFNEYLYQRIDSAFARKPTSYRPRMIAKDLFVGPLASGIITTVAAEGCRSIRQSVILYKNSDRIDFIVDLDKSESGRLLKQPTAQNKEALFYVLPLNVPDFTIHHELPGGVVEPLAHQFEGSTSNYFGIQHMSDLSNGRFGVTVATVNAPLVEYGPPRAALWLSPKDAEFDVKKPSKSWVSLYLMNNMFFTNIPLSQPGPATFRWSIRAHDGDWVAGKGYAFGWDASHPFETFLVDRKHPGVLPATRHSFLTVDDDRVLCTTLKPAEANGEGFILRFFELAGRESTVRVRLPLFKRIARAVETNLVEVDRALVLPITDGNEISFSIAPFGIKTIRVIPAHPDALPPPVGVEAHAQSDREIALSWTAGNPKGVSFYRVYRGATQDFVPSLANCVGTTTRPGFDDRPVLNLGGWLDDRVEPATTYFYRIEAVGSSNARSAPSSVVRATTFSSSEKNSPPGKVLGVAATPVSPISSFNYICLMFSTNVESDVSHYRIFRSETPGFSPDEAHRLIEIDARQKYTHITPHAFATVTREVRGYTMIIYPDESARPNQRYYYKVCAVDDAGQAGECSDEVSAISEIKRLSFAGSFFYFDSTRVEISPVLGDGSEIRYTMDGSEPGPTSQLYTVPLTITKPVTIKAALLYPGKDIAPVTGEAHYMRSLYPPPKYLQPYSDKWPGQGPLNMVDGIHGAEYFDSYFQGFEGNDMDIVVDLGGKKPVREVSVTMLQNIGVWIFLPARAEFYISHDGANFEKVGDVLTDKALEKKEGTFLKTYAISLGEKATNFVRVRAKNIGMCPPWHAGFEYHGKAWIFADEVDIH